MTNSILNLIGEKIANVEGDRDMEFLTITMESGKIFHIYYQIYCGDQGKLEVKER
jgi:hypothetical protein